MSAVWHDLECGSYAEDLALWRTLADRHGDPILDVGAGTGRVTLELARAGHDVTALDLDADLLRELDRRAGTLSVSTVQADARDFELGRRFALCVVPMQTIQLLGGSPGRRAFLSCARRHLVEGGLLVIALAEILDLFDAGHGNGAPLPDMCERDGVLYASHPTAVRADADGFVLERRRETVSPAGEREVELDVIRLDRLSPAGLEAEAVQAGLSPAGRDAIPATRDYSGSVVVMLSA